MGGAIKHCVLCSHKESEIQALEAKTKLHLHHKQINVVLWKLRYLEHVCNAAEVVSKLCSNPSNPLLLRILLAKLSEEFSECRLGSLQFPTRWDSLGKGFLSVYHQMLSVYNNVLSVYYQVFQVQTLCISETRWEQFGNSVNGFLLLTTRCCLFTTICCLFTIRCRLASLHFRPDEIVWEQWEGFLLFWESAVWEQKQCEGFLAVYNQVLPGPDLNRKWHADKSWHSPKPQLLPHSQYGPIMTRLCEEEYWSGASVWDQLGNVIIGH